MLPDLRFAFRQLRKTPGFTVLAVLTLALGVGANTAIFSFFNALLLAPLPYPDADRVVQVSIAPDTGGRAPVSGGVFLDWQDRATQFEALALTHTADSNFTGAGQPQRVSGLAVSAEYLKVFGVVPARGRDFLPAEDAPGGNRHVVIVSHEFWTNHLAANSAMIGRTVRLDGEAYELIGVLPPRALTPAAPEFLIPATLRADAWKQTREYNYVCDVFARLKAGATAASAQAELLTAKQAHNEQYPGFMQPWGVAVQTVQEARYGNSRPYLLLLLGAVALVLLIGCANVASLLLARGTARQSELAVRRALGASRGRIVRLLFAECALLALGGGIAGIGLGAFLIDPIRRLTGMDSITSPEVTIDARVLVFSVTLCVATALLAGLVPVLTASRTSVADDLKQNSRGSSRGRRRLQSALVVGQTAVTVVLLAASGLLLRSFERTLRADPGFRVDDVLVFDLSRAGTASPTNDARVAFNRRVLERLAQLPGVEKTGSVSTIPMNGANYYGDLLRRADRPDNTDTFNAGFDAVAGDYFAALGIPLLRGRLFNEEEKLEEGPKVVVVSQSLARRLYGDEDPVGRFLVTKNATWEIVGVVGDVRRFQLDIDPVPQLYYPQVRFPWTTAVVLRTNVPPLALADSVRRAVLELDPEQPIANARTFERVVADSLRGRTTMLTLLGVFALAALALATLGLYGVMSYTVAQRTRELGIRLALGAEVGQVRRLVLRDGLRLTLAGLAVGAVGSFGARALIENQLFSAQAADPYLVLAVVALTLGSAAAAACWMPARRATRVDPLVALRSE